MVTASLALLVGLAVVLGSAPAEACTCPDREPRHEFIGGSTFPVNGAPAIWFEAESCVGQTTGCPSPELTVSVDGPDGPLDAEVIPLSAYPPTESDRNVAATAFAVQADYVEGETYTVSSSSSDGQGPIEAELIAGPPVSGDEEVVLTVLSREERETFVECDVPADVVVAELELQLPDSLEQYRTLSFTWLEYDGRLVPQDHLDCAEVAPGSSPIGPGRGQITRGCNNGETYSVVGIMTLPMTDIEWRTSPTEVDLRCKGGCSCSVASGTDTGFAAFLCIACLGLLVRRRRDPTTRRTRD